MAPLSTDSRCTQDCFMGQRRHGSARRIQDGYRNRHRGQSCISQIENGQKQLVSLLTDYAQEVETRIRYVGAGARQGCRALRHWTSHAPDKGIRGVTEWGLLIRRRFHSSKTIFARRRCST